MTSVGNSFTEFKNSVSHCNKFIISEWSHCDSEMHLLEMNCFVSTVNYTRSKTFHIFN